MKEIIINCTIFFIVNICGRLVSDTYTSGWTSALIGAGIIYIINRSKFYD